MAWYDQAVTQGFLWTPSTPGAHSGIDIGLAKGTALTALLPGEIVSQGNQPWAWQINIQSDLPGTGPVILSYLHCERATRSVGSFVQAGDTIALSGEPPQTGPYAGRYGKGPHVHFEVSKGQQPPYMGHNGPSNPISGQFLLDAARAGVLDAAPNMLVAGATGVSAQLRQGVSHAPGFLPICQAIDAAEQGPAGGFQITDIGGSVVSYAGATATRGTIVVLGVALLLLVVWNMLRASLQDAMVVGSDVSRIAALTGAT